MNLQGLILIGSPDSPPSVSAAEWLQQNKVTVRLICIDNDARLRAWLWRQTGLANAALPQFFWNGRWCPNGLEQVARLMQAGVIPRGERPPPPPRVHPLVHWAYQRQRHRGEAPPNVPPAPRRPGPKPTPKKPTAPRSGLRQRRSRLIIPGPDSVGVPGLGQHDGDAIFAALPGEVRRAIQHLGRQHYPAGELPVPEATEPNFGVIDRELRRAAVRVILAGRPNVGPSECRRILAALGYDASTHVVAKDLDRAARQLTGRSRPRVVGARKRSLTDDQAAAIATDERPVGVIAAEYGVSTSTVSRVQLGKTYRRATGKEEST